MPVNLLPVSRSKGLSFQELVVRRSAQEAQATGRVEGCAKGGRRQTSSKTLKRSLRKLRKWEAPEVAHGLIQGFIGPDHRVMDMPSFYGALKQALQAAHQQGWNDRARRMQ
jgi:hypothetical protein